MRHSPVHTDKTRKLGLHGALHGVPVTVELILPLTRTRKGSRPRRSHGPRKHCWTCYPSDLGSGLSRVTQLSGLEHNQVGYPTDLNLLV